MLREKYMDLVQNARKDLNVEYVDPDTKAQIQKLENCDDAGRQRSRRPIPVRRHRRTPARRRSSARPGRAPPCRRPSRRSRRRFFAELPALPGVRIATAAAGIKYKGRTDVLMMVFDAPAAAAGVFTTSRCPSAPVDFCRQSLKGGVARALVVNSGNANAFTGRKGREATALTADAAAKALGCRPDEVFLASTGVIGEPLAAEKFSGLLAGLAEEAQPDAWRRAADAIMTTDTYPKVATRTAAIEGVDVAINGIAKGAGHDRAGHGDDAVVRGDRRAHRGGGAAGDAGDGRGAELQLRHRRQRHLDLRHAAAVCHRQGGRARLPADR